VARTRIRAVRHAPAVGSHARPCDPAPCLLIAILERGQAAINIHLFDKSERDYEALAVIKGAVWAEYRPTAAEFRAFDEAWDPDFFRNIWSRKRAKDADMPVVRALIESAREVRPLLQHDADHVASAASNRRRRKKG